MLIVCKFGNTNLQEPIVSCVFNRDARGSHSSFANCKYIENKNTLMPLPHLEHKVMVLKTETVRELKKGLLLEFFSCF